MSRESWGCIKILVVLNDVGRMFLKVISCSIHVGQTDGNEIKNLCGSIVIKGKLHMIEAVSSKGRDFEWVNNQRRCAPSHEPVSAVRLICSAADFGTYLKPQECPGTWLRRIHICTKFTINEMSSIAFLALWSCSFPRVTILLQYVQHLEIRVKNILPLLWNVRVDRKSLSQYLDLNPISESKEENFPTISLSCIIAVPTGDMQVHWDCISKIHQEFGM